MENKMSYKDWHTKGKSLFGEDVKKWKFKCPICGNIQTMEDFIKLGVKNSQDYVFFSCIGRWAKDGKCSTLFDEKIKQPCDYTNVGLFNLSKLTVINQDGKEVSTFEFAEGEVV